MPNCANAPKLFIFQESLAARRLRQGQVLVHPTEGVFGLACRATKQRACQRIAALKRRQRGKSFIVVGANFGQFETLIDASDVDLEPIFASWPGPETWIFPAHRRIPRWLMSSQGTLAVRITAHPQFARLCQAAGPLVSTSANPSGHRPALVIWQARRYFGNHVDGYLAGVLSQAGRPSRIRDARSGYSLRL